MLDVSNELKSALLNDRVKKNIDVEFETEVDPYALKDEDYPLINFTWMNPDRFNLYWSQSTYSSACWSSPNIAKNIQPSIIASVSRSRKIRVEYDLKFTSYVVVMGDPQNAVVPDGVSLGFSYWVNAEENWRWVYTNYNFNPNDLSRVYHVVKEIEVDGPYPYPDDLYSPICLRFRKNGAWIPSDDIRIGFGIEVSNYNLQMAVISEQESMMPYADTKTLYFEPGKSELALLINKITNDKLVKESFQLSESLSSTDNLKFGATEAAICEFDAVGLPDKDLVGEYFRAYISADGIDERLPLGRFRVRKVTKTGSHDIVTKHIEAYDGVYALNRDASNWYTKYMGGINTTPEYHFTSLDGFDFPRQMFSTLYSACKAAGIMLDITNVEDFNIASASIGAGRRIFKEHTDPEEGGYGDSDYIEYVSISTAFSQVNVKKLMRLCLEDIYDYQSEIDAYKEDAPYTNSFGFSPASGILIYVLDNNSNVINQFCVNDNEWFALPDNTDFVIFSIPKKYHLYMGMRLHELILDIPSTIKIQTADFNQLASKNLSARLVYYNWKTFDIAMPSNPSFRDVIRSLIEITGHFFRYGRDGEIEFVKCDVAGLYPRNDLYPDDDLYPRGGLSTEPVPMGRYEYFKADDKATNHFGKIQILLNTPNENEPATKTYKGSDNKNTYVMSDNVFYCSAGVSYALKEDGSEPLPEVLTTLANMYEIIQSVYYTPCEVDAIGMPWVECGDRIGLLTKYGGFETFIFRRTLSGIQRLTDFYEALGQENTDSVPDVWE